tara:strand:+ start:782 stop:1042 length:261 start_codon:yes stop_codon:yes gene_type:complete
MPFGDDMKYFMLLSLIANGHAQGTEDPEVIYKKKTEIDFEGVQIEGDLVRPEGTLLLERKGAKFNPMIKLRRDFDEEMEKSVQEIK